MVIELSESGRDFVARDFRVGECFARMNAMPGRKKWIDRLLAFEPSGANIAHILLHWPEAVWEDGASDLRDKYIQLKMQEENVRAEKSESLVDSSGYEHKVVPWKHQQQAFLLSRDARNFALFHEQRTGKTKVVIDTAAYLYEKEEIDTLIVITKNGVHINWVINEIPAHLPDRIPRISAFYTNQWSAPEYKHMLASSRSATGVFRFLSFPVEGLGTDRAREMLDAWVRNSRAMMVVDESSCIKNYSAARTKYIIKAGAGAAYKRIMTGTPLTSGVENLFPQFKFLDPNILGYSSFYTFRAAFCIMGGFEGRAIVGYKHVDDLIKTIDGHSHRVLRSQCFDMPKKIWTRRMFEMGPHQRKLYDAYRRDSIEEVTGMLAKPGEGDERREKMAGEIAITKALRLQQIACGYTPDKEMKPLEGPNLRIVAMMEEIEEAEADGRKVIVWARFKRDLTAIFDKLGSKAVRYHGDVSEKERIEAMQRFQQDDTVRIFVGHVQAAAYGLTLSAAESMIYHSNLSSLDLRLQSEDRAESPSSKRGTNIIDVAATRSIDQKVVTALRKHKALADQINRDPLSLFMEEEETTDV